FVSTPDGPALLAVAAALLLVDGPAVGVGRAAGAGALLFGAALAKVVAVPIGLALGLGMRQARWPARVLPALGPLLGLPLGAASLRFQLSHAFGQAAPGGWSAGAALGALGAALSAQALLWSPAVMWLGLRGLGALPRPDRALVIGLSALVAVS